ncbi:MAG: hypothetical protein PHV51_02710 [Methanosarcinaceae archaeon]|nr:hypothetical protein [Methanosarcinaceae archaeon]
MVKKVTEYPEWGVGHLISGGGVDGVLMGGKEVWRKIHEKKSFSQMP